MKWTRETHDVVAFCGTDLYEHMMKSKITNHLHILGDRAFCAIGEQLIIPYSNSIFGPRT